MGAPRLPTIFEAGSRIPRPLPDGEWLEYMHSLIREPYTGEEVDRFIRCCEANRTRLSQDPQLHGALVARADAALDAGQMGGQMPPDKLIDYVFDKLIPMGEGAAKAWDQAITATADAKDNAPSEERPLAADGSEFGVVGRDGARRILDTKAERERARKEKGEDPSFRR